jgi:hypothetical protein
LALTLALASCGKRLVIVGDEKKGPVWIPGSVKDIRKLIDPAELRRLEEEAEKEFSPPADPESVFYLCRHLRAALAGKKINSASFLKDAPDELKKDYQGIMFVSVYGKNAKLFKAAAKGKTAAKAALKAIKLLTRKTRGKLTARLESLPVKIDFTEKMFAVETPGAARQVFVQCVDGLFLPDNSGEYRLPAELMAFSPADTADIAIYFSMLPQSDTLRRFRTSAFLQTKAGEQPVKLMRSLPPIPEIDKKVLRERIIAACEYLLRNQREDGAYAYQYAANRDKFPKLTEESMIRHMATAAMMILTGETLKRQDFIDSGAKSLAWVKPGIKRENGLAYLLKNARGTLGGSGILTWALSHRRRVTGKKDYDLLAREAADFILFLQKPDGSFCNFYDPASKKPVDKPTRYYEGEACLGLYWYYNVYGGQKYLDAALRAAEALCERFLTQFSKGKYPVDAWVMQAVRFLYPLASEKQKEKMLAAVKKMAYAMVNAQRTTAQAAGYPDLVGCFSSLSQQLPGGPATAALCEGLAAVYHLLDSLGKPDEKIKSTLLIAASFQLRHQFRDRNMYFLPSPARASGGIKGTLTDNLVRIDHVQHTVGIWLQLLKILE